MEKTIEAKRGDILLSFLSQEEKDKYICAKVNGKIKSLTYPFEKNGTYQVVFYDLRNPIATRIYSTSLRYLVSMAAKIVFPKCELRFFYNISRSLFCKVISPKSFHLNPMNVEMIVEKIKELVKEDIPLSLIKVSKGEAIEKYRQLEFKDKIQVLKYRKESYVHLYQAKGKDINYVDYLYSVLVPSTGYLTKYQIRYYAPGMLIQVPRSECNGIIPEFFDETKFAKSLQANSLWAENNELDTVYKINRFVKKYSPLALINLCEARFNDNLAELSNRIINREFPIRLICIAGPSSSGKTSFANRLTFDLMAHGLRPVRISMDDYYIPRDLLPKGTSLESVEALDIALFNTQMDALIRGESVTLPYYDFKDKTRKEGKKLCIDETQPLIVEGIHALNERICSNIPDYQKFRIYISPQPQVNIDDHTPISMTDIRLLRRISRDSRTRNTSAKETISMWPSVRQGEFDYIYSTQENADYVFDSFMPYELCALRNIALPKLEEITPDEEEFSTASRLRALFKYFIPINCNDIPCNSLLREFVGGSSFKDAR